MTPENKVIDNALTVEEATELALTKKVSYATQFLRGTANTYTLKITNNGNMTAYSVPIYAYIETGAADNISYVKFDGLNLPSILDAVDTDSLSSVELSELKQISEEIGDSHYFLNIKKYDEEKGDTVFVKSGYFYTNLQPHETKTISLKIKSKGRIEVWFTAPDDIDAITQYDEAVNRPAKARAKSNHDNQWYCCYKEGIECWTNAIVVGLDFGSLLSPSQSVSVLDCIAGVLNEGNKVFAGLYCDTDTSLKDKLKKTNWGAKGTSLLAVTLSCVSAFIPNKIASKVLSGIVVAIDLATIKETFTGCRPAFTLKMPGCPPPPPKGGGSTPVNSLDPNDITGYTAESGSHFVKKDLVDVNYKIEFENDPEFATASAHVVVVKDTLDGKLFDLATYAPTGIKIGEKTTELDGAPNFVKTIDMRPAINAIAQVEGAFDKAKGIATWTFTSLDPMTMEPTDDVMQGFLPVNDDNGSGQGEVTFDIKLRNGLANGTDVPNRASIVFDNEEAIMTPTWVNTMDFTAPSSRIRDSRVDGDSITLYFEGRDSGSGVWKYDVYQLAGDAEKWRMVAEGVTADSCRVRYYEGFDYNFSVIATDKAGNVEDKELSVLPELDCDLQLKAGWNWVSTFLNSPQPVAEMFDKGVNRVMSQTHESIKDPVFGVVGQIMSMQPGVGYKVSSEADFTVSYMGRLHNLAESPIEVKKGWNWIAYPYHESREIGMAIVNADEDDLISSQRGYAEFADGTWEGSISSLEAGLGYLYRSATDKTLAFDFQTPSPMAKAASADGLRPDTESGVDPHKYPSTMNVTARLYRDGAAITDSHYVVYAMSDDELRGEGRCVNGTHYITVYGDQPVEISFVIEDTDTGDTYEACETVTFTSDAVGSRKSPFTLTFGEATSIAGVESEPNAATHTVSGIRVERIDKPGIYIRNGKKISVPARQQ